MNPFVKYNSYYQLDSRIAPAFAELIRAYNVFFNENRVIASLYSLYVDLVYKPVENGEAYISLDQLPKLFDNLVTTLEVKFIEQPKDRLITYSYIFFNKRYFVVEGALNDIVKESAKGVAIYHVAFYCLNIITVIFRALSKALRLNLGQLYVKNLQRNLTSNQLKPIENAIIQFFRTTIKNTNNTRNDMNKAKELFELWCSEQAALYTKTIQSPTEEKSIASGIRDFAWSELVSGNSLTPNWEKDKQRLKKYHKSQCKAQFESSMKCAVTEEQQNIYKNFCNKLLNLRQKLRYFQGPIMKRNSKSGYVFEKSFIEHFYFIAWQTGFMQLQLYSTISLCSDHEGEIQYTVNTKNERENVMMTIKDIPRTTTYNLDSKSLHGVDKDTIINLASDHPALHIANQGLCAEVLSEILKKYNIILGNGFSDLPHLKDKVGHVYNVLKNTVSYQNFLREVHNTNNFYEINVKGSLDSNKVKVNMSYKLTKVSESYILNLKRV